VLSGIARLAANQIGQFQTTACRGAATLNLTRKFRNCAPLMAAFALLLLRV
jgi:hypothetical protein